MRQSLALRGASSCSSLFRPTAVLLKRSGKSAETPEYKQAYFPYEAKAAPTAAELDRERRRFSQCYFGKESGRKLVEVRDVPQNMYTYGKEGMTVPIAIFKDQTDPIIGAEHTYPGIYENKIACQHMYTYELFEMERANNFNSPLQRQVLHNQINKRIRRMTSRIGMMTLKESIPMTKDRGASAATKTTKVGGAAATPAAATPAAGKNPDKAKAK
jgi:hypothetical protein